MKEKTCQTRCGMIHYWASVSNPDAITLVFLPGLTADHRLFDKQIQYFENRYNVIVWDAPAHASSWPFRFDLFDKAKWLNDILNQEGIIKPVIIGQSMGGYVGQAYAQLYPDKLTGFVSIDSAPLQRCYVTAVEIWLLKRMEPVYAHYPWKLLLKQGTEGVATSDYGRNLMHEMMLVYDGNQKRYAQIAGHGYRILAAAMERNLPYEIKCPALLICGTQDHAGSCIRYNKAWHRNTKIPLTWIEGAGHNSNTDKPEQINRLIEEFVSYFITDKFAFVERSGTMKAPVGLLSDRTVLRQQDGGVSPRQVPVCRADRRLENGKPVWGRNCTHCMACICYCPKEAIEYGKKSKGKPRYHFEALEKKQQDV